MNKRYILCLYAGVLFTAVLCVTMTSRLLSKSRDTGQESAADTVSCPVPDQPCLTVADFEIALWPKDGQYYAFLPSACEDAGLEPEFPEEIDSSSIIQMNSCYIPAVFIESESGISDKINNDRNIKESGSITVLEADGSISLKLPLEYIKSRGNTSYTEFDKKSYQIKLTESLPFLGMDSGKRWIFISNSADSTLLRNALARKLGSQLNLAQSESGTFVDLYLNKEYLGNYYVVEKIEVAENRLQISDLEKATEYKNKVDDLSVYETAWTDTTKAKQIPEDPIDITGGYLIERDFSGRFLKEVETNGSYFITDSKECFIVRSPEFASEAQIAYINDYVQHVENAILSAEGIDGSTGKSYQDLIDVDSFVRKYLLEEVTDNYDGGVASSYFYKDSDTLDGKLHAGPVWDYDVSWGNAPAHIGQTSISPEKLTKLFSRSDSTFWFQSLYEKPEFYQEVISCYKNEVSPYLSVLADEILPALDEITAASAAMDYVRWQEQYQKNGYDTDRNEEITFLSNYIKDRKNFLDQAWIEQIPVHQIALLIEGNLYETLYVLHNDTLPEFPQVPSEYVQVTAWVSAESGTLPDFTASVTEDMVFQAVLQ